MTREEIKQEFITKQPSINECESCPNKGIRLWKCAELHGCKWAQAMMEIAKMLESEPCDDCKLRRDVRELKELLGYIRKYGTVADKTPSHIAQRFCEIVDGWEEQEVEQ